MPADARNVTRDELLVGAALVAMTIGLGLAVRALDRAEREALEAWRTIRL